MKSIISANVRWSFGTSLLVIGMSSVGLWAALVFIYMSVLPN